MIQGRNGAARDPALGNAASLARSIESTMKKNAHKYLAIKQLNPDYDTPLYAPSIPSHAARSEIGLASQIMLRQIDKLMEEQSNLDLQLDLLTLKATEKRRKKEREERQSMDHFTFLRKQWQDEEEPRSPQQQAERLIHNVGAIKGHINSLIRKESESTSMPELHSLITQSPEYLALEKRVLLLEDKAGNHQDSECSTRDTMEIERLREELRVVREQNALLKRKESKKYDGWIYNYRVEGENGKYAITVQSNSRANGMPSKSALNLEQLAAALGETEQKIAKNYCPAAEVGKELMEEIFSPKFISRKRGDLGGRYRFMSP